nr:MAG TPA: hypothetical protein [Caudoviricetes sp.]
MHNVNIHTHNASVQCSYSKGNNKVPITPKRL